MILRELFEARAKAKSVGIIFGRFNPPHMGHMKAWEMASENSTWYVGTNKSTQGPKDPLPFDIKVKAMEAVYPEIKGHIVAEQSWLTLASKVYKKHGNIVLNVYTDEDWVTKALVQYNGKEGAHGYYDFGTIQQQATPRLSSATSLRNAVAADDRDLFGQAAGVDPNTLVAGHPFFDVVKHYLMPHAEKAAAKPVKKKVKQPEQDMAEDDAHDVEQRMIAKIAKYKERLAHLKKTDPEAYKREMEKRKTSSRIPPVSTFEEQGVAEAYTPSAGELARDLIKMPDSDFSKKYGMSKQQANHYYSSSKLKEQGVAEGSGFDKWADDRAASQLHKLKPGMVQDRKTGKWYDPNKEFDKKMNSPEVMAQMKRMAQKEGVAEGSLEEYGDTAKGQKMLTKVQKRAVDRVVSKKADTDPAYAKKNKDTADRAWDRMTDKDVAENAWDRLQREKAMECAGVGIITKQNSTVDVNKNTPKKNLKAFRLI